MKKVLLFVSTMVLGTTTEAQVYKVDHSLSPEEMLSASKADWIDTTIAQLSPLLFRHPDTCLNCVIPFEPQVLSYSKKTWGRKECFISTRRVLRRMARDGFRPATVEELLAYNSVHPEGRVDGPIVALGSEARLDKDRFVVSLYQCTVGHCIDAWSRTSGQKWYCGNGFLGVRK